MTAASTGVTGKAESALWKSLCAAAPAAAAAPVTGSASAAAAAAAAASAGIASSAVWLSSTVKKRKMAMNKHKLKKRRKGLRMNTKVSRGSVR